MSEKKIGALLSKLKAADPHIEGAALISSDGLMIESELPPYLEEDRISAMSAALLSLGERAVEELEKGTPEQVTVKGEKGYIVLSAAGGEAILIVLTDSNAKLGLVYLYIKNISKEIRSMLEL